MALIPLNQLEESIPEEPRSSIPYQVQNTTETTTAQSVSSNFLYNNWIASKLTQETTDADYVDPSYDFKKGVVGTKYEPYLNRLAETVNPLQQAAVLKQIDLEESMLQDMSSSGSLAALTGGLAAGLIDPINLIPGFGIYRSLKTASAVVKGALSGAVLTGGAVAVQEGLLSSSQVTRSNEDMIINSLAGAVLGGILGAGAGAFFNSSRPGETLTKILKGDDLAIPDTAPRSVGAGEAQPINPLNKATFVSESFREAHPKIADAVDKIIINTTQLPWLHHPGLEGVTNDSPLIRQLTADYFNIPVQLRSHLKEATAPSMEEMTWLDDIAAFKHAQRVDDLFTKYKMSLPSGQNALSRSEFDTEIFRAYNRGDYSDIKEASQAARMIREEIKKVNDELVKLGRLTEEDAALINSGDMTRAWNKEYIRTGNNRVRLAQVLTKHFANTKGLDEVEARSLANDSISHILGLEDGSNVLDTVMRESVDKGVRFTKPRTIDIPNSSIEEFLHQDFTALSMQYLRQASQMRRFLEVLDRRGADSINDLKRLLDDEYQKNIIAAGDNAKLIEKISKSFEKNQKILKDFTRLALGQFTSVSPKTDKFFRYLRRYNYVRLMGYGPLSNLPDLAVPVFKHGFGHVFTGYYRGFKAMANSEFRKLAKTELQDLGTTIEIQQNAIIRNILDPDFSIKTERGWLKYADRGADIYSKATGMTHLNTLSKSMSAFTAEARIMRDLLNYKNLDQAAITNLNAHHIGAEHVDELVSLFKKHGGFENGTPLLNLSEWGDSEAVIRLRAALQKSIRGGAVPGKADVPLLAQSSEMTKTIFMFKGIVSTLHAHILLAGLQRRDLAVVEGIGTMIALGMLSHIAKSALRNEEIDLSPERLALEGVSNAAVLGLVGDQLFGNVLQSMKTGAKLSRYNNRTRFETYLGPSASILTGLDKIRSNLWNGKFDMSTAEEVGKLLPAQNLWYLDTLLRHSGIKGKKK